MSFIEVKCVGSSFWCIPLHEIPEEKTMTVFSNSYGLIFISKEFCVNLNFIALHIRA